MPHRAVARGAFSGRHFPRGRGRGDQHVARHRARTSQLVPAVRNGTRATGALPAIHGRVHRRLLDHDVAPLRIQLLGNDERKGRLDALTDFRSLAVDEDGALARNAQESIRRELSCRWARGFTCCLRVGAHAERQRKASARHARQFQEAASIEPGGAERGVASAHLDVAHQFAQRLIGSRFRIHARVHRAFS